MTPTITTFQLDPKTGLPSNPADTVMPTTMISVGRLVVDPSSSILFTTSTVPGIHTICPVAREGLVVPIQIAKGQLTVGTPVGTGHANGGGVAIDPTSHTVFATGGNIGPFPFGGRGGGVSTLAYDPTTGALTASTAPLLSASNASSVALDPTGKFLFAGDYSGGSVYGFSNASGTITPVAGSPFATAPGKAGAANHDVTSVAVHPSGKFLYAGTSDTTVASFSSSGGVLTPMQSVLADQSIWEVYAIAIDPMGRFLYSANGIDGSVTAFAIDQATGLLSPIGSPLALNGSEPVDIVVNASGDFVYVVDANANGIWTLSVSPTGTLAPVGQPITLPSGDTLPMHAAVSQ
jgi:6-phosphogluconolactonase (cycloisomerase 2 family)